MTHPKPKKKRGVTRKTAVRRADTAFSLYIRARDGRCVVCGSTDNLTCGHVFSRAHYATRWDENNAFGQCMGCNLKHERDPSPFLEYAKMVHGTLEIAMLHQKFLTPTKMTTAEIMGIAITYEAKLANLEESRSNV